MSRRLCTKCKATKHDSSFDQGRNVCKACRMDQQRDIRARNIHKANIGHLLNAWKRPDVEA